MGEEVSQTLQREELNLKESIKICELWSDTVFQYNERGLKMTIFHSNDNPCHSPKLNPNKFS